MASKIVRSKGLMVEKCVVDAPHFKVYFLTHLTINTGPKMSTSKTIVLLSGGIDSTATLHYCLGQHPQVCALFVDYGQPARNAEANAANAICRKFSVPLTTLQLVGATQKEAGLIVARNSFLINCALMEAAPGPVGIAIGVHSGTEYWDCSQGFLDAIQPVLDGYTGGTAQLLAPFLEWTKREVFSYSQNHRLPLDLTYSCERGEKQPCGLCASCKDLEVLNAGK